MRLFTLLAGLILSNTTFCLGIPHPVGTSKSTTAPIIASTDDHSADVLTIPISPDSIAPMTDDQKMEQRSTEQKRTLGSNAHLFGKREPVPYIFEFGRNKGYYELNGVRATDHLYDIKDEEALGKEVVRIETDALMEKIWNKVDGVRKKVDVQ